MSPIFTTLSDSAAQLAAKIKDENIQNYSLFYISPDSQQFANMVAKILNTSVSEMFDPQLLIINYKFLIIIDSGSSRASEFNEYTDVIRKKFPEINIIIAVPVIPESEKSTFESVCDTLIYIHSDPLFFSVNQFYQQISA
jgi:hypothetical protein